MSAILSKYFFEIGQKTSIYDLETEMSCWAKTRKCLTENVEVSRADTILHTRAGLLTNPRISYMGGLEIVIEKVGKFPTLLVQNQV